MKNNKLNCADSLDINEIWILIWKKTTLFSHRILIFVFRGIARKTLNTQIFHPCTSSNRYLFLLCLMSFSIVSYESQLISNSSTAHAWTSFMVDDGLTQFRRKTEPISETTTEDKMKTKTHRRRVPCIEDISFFFLNGQPFIEILL